MKEALKNALVLIARQPKIRTVEIADLIDCDTELVEPMLKPHIDAKHIELIPVTAPNGRPANAFMLTAAYRKTDEFREIAAIAFPVEPDTENEVAPVESAAGESPTPVSAAAPAATTAPTANAEQEIDPDVQLSKVELAIRFIRSHGSANGNQLRELLKLESHQYPLAYLKSAVYSGRLKLDGGSYYIGDGTPATPRLKKRNARPASEAKPTSPPSKPKSEKADKAPIVSGPKSPLMERTIRSECERMGIDIDSIKPLNTVTPTRFAIWSDGQIEIQRDGKLICALQGSEAAELAKFIAAHRIAA